MTCLNLYIGYKLNLFKILAEAGEITSAEFIGKTKLSKRYLQEWLECMTVQGYIEFDSATGNFTLPLEHQAVLCDRDNEAYTIPFVCWIPSFSLVLEKLIDAFRTGEGIPYSHYGQDLIEAQGEGNRPIFINNIATWIAVMPDLKEKFETIGGKVADVGCGDGWASIALAKAFPLTKIDAIDVDEMSIENTRKNIKKNNLSDRITVHNMPIEKISHKDQYDLVMCFESIHDMAYPVDALNQMRKMVLPNGSVLIADVKMNENLNDKKDFPGKLYYNFSVLLCLPQSLVYPDSKGTGAAMSPSAFQRYVKEAGFSKTEILSVDHFLWRFYRLKP
jgi:2-polyprenyl-3-methyl-5-hydroxy-6-metoxy-1,4-benzoquinol methylase